MNFNEFKWWMNLNSCDRQASGTRWQFCFYKEKDSKIIKKYNEIRSSGMTSLWTALHIRFLSTPGRRDRKCRDTDSHGSTVLPRSWVKTVHSLGTLYSNNFFCSLWYCIFEKKICEFRCNIYIYRVKNC